MARKANTALTLEITADKLHSDDVIVGTDGQTYCVGRVDRKGDRVTVTLWDHRSWTLGQTRKVTVRAEHECDCRGKGVYYGRGYVENGVFKGTTGPHFACGGKGWQTREDAIRNRVYWDKYARIAL